jgi:uroporphyrin-III C-methyltransferase/precorrin-2 dehydrogenase/sirohydrochlorin ferrochelatase
MRALQMADVVLYDTMVTEPVLALIGPKAERIHVGKKGYGHSRPQAEINDQMITLARAGQCVVRLKSGDPLIFGRATEEIDACRSAGVPMEIVPGITAAQGAAASLCTSLTQRGVARRLQYITGHDMTGDLPQSIDWSIVADPSTTTVVYMPRRTIGAFGAAAAKAGMNASTPAVIVVNATRPDERCVRTTMARIVEALEATATTDPTLVLVGHVFADNPICTPTGEMAATTNH